MTALLTVYWICFATGLIYVLLSGLLGAFGHGHGGGGHDSTVDVHTDTGGMESADLDTDASGLDEAPMDAGLSDTGTDGLDHAQPEGLGHGGGKIDHSHDGAVTEYNPLSPLSLMGFLCAFGGTGIIASAYNLNLLFSVLLAVGGGIVMALLMWLLVGKLLFSMQGSSEAHLADVIGLEAEALTPVESEMAGEIAYVLDGVRYTSPARLAHPGSIAKHTTVRIKRIDNNVAYVEEKRKLLA